MIRPHTKTDTSKLGLGFIGLVGCALGSKDWIDLKSFEPRPPTQSAETQGATAHSYMYGPEDSH